MLYDQIRSQRGGGGIALLSHTELSVTLHTAGEKNSFEFAEYIESPPKWYKKLKFLDSDSDKKALRSTFSHFICT